MDSNIKQIHGLKFSEEKALMPGVLNSNDEPLYLITPYELELLPNNTILYSITGEKVLKGTNRIDGDTRGGLLAYGFKESQFND